MDVHPAHETKLWAAVRATIMKFTDISVLANYRVACRVLRSTLLLAKYTFAAGWG